MQEARLREAQAALRAEVDNLTKLVEAGAGMGSADEDQRRELLRQNEELTREREAQACSSWLVPHPTSRIPVHLLLSPGPDSSGQQPRRSRRSKPQVLSMPLLNVGSLQAFVK